MGLVWHLTIDDKRSQDFIPNRDFILKGASKSKGNIQVYAENQLPVRSCGCKDLGFDSVCTGQDIEALLNIIYSDIIGIIYRILLLANL